MSQPVLGSQVRDPAPGAHHPVPLGQAQDGDSRVRFSNLRAGLRAFRGLLVVGLRAPEELLLALRVRDLEGKRGRDRELTLGFGLVGQGIYFERLIRCNSKYSIFFIHMKVLQI